MGSLPGQQRGPAHKVQALPLAPSLTVAVDGQAVAESRRVIRGDEPPVRYVLPRFDVRMDLLERAACRL